MSERAATIQRIDQLVEELKRIGTEKDLRIFCTTATSLMDNIRTGKAVWNK